MFRLLGLPLGTKRKRRRVFWGTTGILIPHIFWPQRPAPPPSPSLGVSKRSVGKVAVGLVSKVLPAQGAVFRIPPFGVGYWGSFGKCLLAVFCLFMFFWGLVTGPGLNGDQPRGGVFWADVPTTWDDCSSFLDTACSFDEVRAGRAGVSADGVLLLTSDSCAAPYIRRGPVLKGASRLNRSLIKKAGCGRPHPSLMNSKWGSGVHLDAVSRKELLNGMLRKGMKSPGPGVSAQNIDIRLYNFCCRLGRGVGPTELNASAVICSSVRGCLAMMGVSVGGVQRCCVVQKRVRWVQF